MATRYLGLLLCGTLSALFAGCGAALEAAQVKSRFHTLFACEATRTLAEGGGYRVEGCGRVAHFRCFDNDAYRYGRDPHHYQQPIGAALAEAIFAGFFSSDTCVLEHTTEATPRALRAGPALVAARKTPEGPLVRTRVLLAGGYLTLRSKPLEHAQQVLMTLHSTVRLEPEPCSAQLFHDGVPVSIEQIRRSSDYDVQLLIRVTALQQLDRAVRFAGDACGKAFVLDQHARTTLALFEARVREELARSQVQVAARHLVAPAATPSQVAAAEPAL